MDKFLAKLQGQTINVHGGAQRSFTGKLLEYAMIGDTPIVKIEIKGKEGNFVVLCLLASDVISYGKLIGAIDLQIH